MFVQRWFIGLMALSCFPTLGYSTFLYLFSRLADSTYGISVFFQRLNIALIALSSFSTELGFCTFGTFTFSARHLDIAFMAVSVFCQGRLLRLYHISHFCLAWIKLGYDITFCSFSSENGFPDSFFFFWQGADAQFHVTRCVVSYVPTACPSTYQNYDWQCDAFA